MGKVIEAVDLFCGAGGTSSGLRNACLRLGIDVKLKAVNHWNLAIRTHSANHEDAEHLCADLESVDPHDVVPGGRLRLLVASPECTHFSVARGGKPVNNQKRAGARYVINWAEKLFIENILIENVREWQKWGPIHTNPNSKHYLKPIKAKEGEFFYAFIRDLETLDYVVEHKVLRAADYGAPTTRERFFLQAKKRIRGVKVAITWPEPTHKRPGSENQGGLFADNRKPWRTAREIIDWDLKGKSVFHRKKPLAPTTIKRMIAGFEKAGPSGVPFVLALESLLPVEDQKVTRPGITVQWDLSPAEIARGFGVESFTLGQQSGSVARDVDEPLPTIATDGAISLTEGRIIPMQRKQNPTDIEQPLPTVTATSSDFGLMEAEQFMVPFFGERSGQTPRTHSADEPMPTVTSHGAGGLVEGFLTKLNHKDARSYPVDRPLVTLTSEDTMALVDGKSFVFPHQRRESQIRDVDEPLHTVTASSSDFALIESEAFLVTASHGHDGPTSHARRAHSIDEPMKTITGSNDYGVVQPMIVELRNNCNTSPVDEPLTTITAGGTHHGLMEAFITTAGGAEGQGRTATQMSETIGTILTNDRRGLVEGAAFITPTNHGKGDERTYPLNKPMPVITTVDALGFVQGEVQKADPFLAKFYGTAKTADVSDPLDTVTSKDRFGLVEGEWVLVTTPEGQRYAVAIRFRMLQPKELAAGQSFDPGYKFEGSREDIVKQIGNAVPPKLAEALIYEMLRPVEKAGRVFKEELAA